MDVQYAFVCGCDVPLLMPAFVERMFELCGNHQIAVVDDGERLHPLGGVYRTDVVATAETLLAAGERSLLPLVKRCQALTVPGDELRDVDPQLLSLSPCNSLEEYNQALAQSQRHEQG